MKKAYCMQTSSPRQVLRDTFGYREFREHQAAIIDTLMEGRDAFALMPTGSGKSLCYQVPAIIGRGVGIVISPLIALMKDQVDALRQNGVEAEYLNSSLSAPEAAAVEGRLLSGRTDLLYVAPERIVTERFQALLARLTVILFAIDEAHCVSQWGHDFRPEYLRIAEVTANFPQVPRIALTATADPVTRKDILAKLDLAQAQQFVSSFDRPNICYQVHLKSQAKRQLLDFITKEHPDESGIVYVRTRDRADAIARWLTEKGVKALSYHAGLDARTRQIHQQRFIGEDGLVMAATIAFGMGIDKPDVRFVVHLDLPASVEAYYQETGRAGRDGLPADAWMLYSLADLVAMKKLLALSEADETFKRIRQRKLDALVAYCETAECRREALLAYFGEPYPSPCDNCDTCTQEIQTWDATIAAQKALSCVYRTGQRFGAAYLTDVLLGNENDRIRRWGHHSIKTFGAGRDLTRSRWLSVFRQLLAAGFLSTNTSEIAGFHLTEKSRQVLKGERRIRLRRDPRPFKAPRKARLREDLELCEDAGTRRLWDRLRRLRREIASQNGLPPYVVFHDKTLKEMALLRPKTREELLQVSGVGAAKAGRYGRLFLDAIGEGED